MLSYPAIASRGVLSLDPFTEGEFSLGVSRLFELSGSQLKSIGLINRPGTDLLEAQIARIPKHVPLSLVEDDIGTGQTLSTIREMLKEHQIRDVRVLLQLASNKDYHDVADCRDFLCGALMGGLVVRLPNDKIARVPYLWQPVRVTERARVLRVPPREGTARTEYPALGVESGILQQECDEDRRRRRLFPQPCGVSAVW